MLAPCTSFRARKCQRRSRAHSRIVCPVRSARRLCLRSPCLFHLSLGSATHRCSPRPCICRESLSREPSPRNRHSHDMYGRARIFEDMRRPRQCSSLHHSYDYHCRLKLHTCRRSNADSGSQHRCCSPSQSCRAGFRYHTSQARGTSRRNPGRFRCRFSSRPNTWAAEVEEVPRPTATQCPTHLTCQKSPN